jgi:hypothetical protein
MPFTANPFDMKGSVDTTGYGLPAPSAMKGHVGTTFGATAVGSAYNDSGTNETTSEVSVSAVTAAFTDGSLATDATNRVQPDQRLSFRTY